MQIERTSLALGCRPHLKRSLKRQFVNSIYRSSKSWSFFFYYFYRKICLNMNNLVDTMEGFFDNVSNSPSINKITKLFNNWIETEYDLGFVSTFTHHIPSPVFEFNPKKFIFSIYSTVFKYIRYDFQISDFVKDVMTSTDNDGNYIFGRCKIDEYKSILIVWLEYKDKRGSTIITKEYELKLIPSPFAKMRDAFLKENSNGGWITDAMDQLEVNDNKSKYKVEDIKKAIKEIYDLL